MILIKNRPIMLMMSLLLNLPLFITGLQKKEIKHIELHYTSPFKKIKEFNDDVYLVSDFHEKKFVLKQHKNPVAVIREIIASEMGENIVNINKVQIISYNSLKGIELNSNMLYTLHEYILGERDDNINIEKAIRDKIHLEGISKNDKSLAQIAAFNMYINNFDGHSRNLLKNDKTNQFYAIDMDNAFEKSIQRHLCSITHNYLKELNEIGLCNITMTELKSIDFYDNLNKNLYKLMNQYSSEYVYTQQVANELVDLPFCSPLVATTTHTYLMTLQRDKLVEKEINALKVFDETLDKLINQYPPKKIYKRWIEIANKLNYDCNKIEKDILLIILNKNFEETKNVRLELKRLCYDSDRSDVMHWLYQKIQDVIQAANNIITAPGDYVFDKDASIIKNAFNCTACILFIFYASYHLNALESFLV